MNKFLLTIILLIFTFVNGVTAQSDKIFIEWKNAPSSCTISASNGKVDKIEIISGKGKVTGSGFKSRGKAPIRIAVTIGNAQIKAGANATIVHVMTACNPFSFFLRDVNSLNPVFIPRYGAAVFIGNDSRTYADIEKQQDKLNYRTKQQIIESKPEDSFASVEKHTRNMSAPIWLGHLQQKAPSKVSGGLYNATTETVIIDNFTGKATVRLEYR